MRLPGAPHLYGRWRAVAHRDPVGAGNAFGSRGRYRLLVSVELWDAGRVEAGVLVMGWRVSGRFRPLGDIG